MANPKKRTASGVYQALNDISKEAGIDFGLSDYTEESFKKKYFTGPGNINNLYNKLNQISDETNVDFGLGSQDEWLASFGYKRNGNSYQTLDGRRLTGSSGQQKAATKTQPTGQTTTPAAVPQGTQSGLPEGFGELNPEAGLPTYLQGEAKKRREESYGTDDAALVQRRKTEQTMKAVRGDKEAAKEVGLDKVNEQLRDRMDYTMATGEELKMPDDGIDYNAIGIAPTVARDEEGNVVYGEDGRPIVGITNDEQRANTQRVEQERVYQEDLQRQIDEANADLDLLNEKMAAVSPEWVDQDGRVHYSGGRGSDEEYAALRAAYQSTQERLKGLEQEQRGGRHGFFYGLYDAATDKSTWMLGLDKIEDNITMLRVSDKVKRGEELTDAEQAMLDASIANSQVQQRLDEDSDWLYRTGRMTTEMMPFMGQIMLTGGYGSIAAVGERMGQKWATAYARKFGEKALLNRINMNIIRGFGIGMGDVAAGFASANTTGVANTLNDAMQRRIGQLGYDEKGNYAFTDDEDWFRAFMKAEVSQTKEFATERFGEHLPGLRRLNVALAKQGPRARELARALSGFAGTKAMTKTAQWLRKGGVNGVFGEILEEEIGLPVDVAIGDMTWEDALSGKNQWDIVGGMLLSIGAMHSVGLVAQGGNKVANTGQYYWYKRKADNADHVASFRLTADRWAPVKERIDGTTSEDMSSLWDEIRNDNSYAVQEKRAIYDYINTLTLMRGYNMGMLFGAHEAAKDDRLRPGETTPDESIELSVMAAEDEGRTAETPDEKKMFVDEADAAGARVRELLTANNWSSTQIDDFITVKNPGVMLVTMLDNRALFSDEEIEAVADYYTKRARAEGVMDAALEGVDLQVAVANSNVQANMHQGTQQVIEVGIGNDGYYVVGGDLRLTPDGTGIDTEASGQAIIVKNAATGEIEVKSPLQMQLQSVTDAQSLIDYNENELRSQLMQQADEDITFGEPQNEVFQLNDEVVLSDGEGGVVEGVVTGATPEGALLVETADGVLPMTEQELNRKIVGHNGVDLTGGEMEAAAESQPMGQEGEEVAMASQQTEPEEDNLVATINAARAGDVEAQKKLDKYGIKWEKKPVVRFVAKGEVDSILNGERYDGRFGNGRVDVTNSTDVTTAATADYRITFKDELDWATNDRLRMKNEDLGDGYIMDGYSLDDVATIEKKNDDGTYSIVYDANNPVQQTEQPIEQMDENAMPMIGEGEDAEPDFTKATPERAHTFVYDEAGLSREEADQFVLANEKAAKNTLEKLQKKQPQIGTSLAKYRKEQTEWQAKVDAAQQQVDYWDAVTSLQNERVKAEQEAEFQERQQEASGRQSLIDEQRDLQSKMATAKRVYGDYFDDDLSMPHDVMELVALNMPRNISWEGRENVRGLQQELGLRRGVGRNADSNAFNMYLAKKGEGIGIEQAVHNIWESPMNEMANGEKRYDDQEIRNALLEMFMSAQKPSDIRDYVLNSRIEQAETARAQEDAAMMEAELDAWADAYHLEPEERESFNAYITQAGEEISRMSDEDIQKIIAIFANPNTIDYEQNRRSQGVDQQPVTEGAGSEGPGSQAQVQGESAEESGLQYSGQQTAEGREAVENREDISDNDVSGGALVSPDVDLQRMQAIRQALADAYRSGDETAIGLAAEQVQAYVDEGLDDYRTYDEAVDDYEGRDPEMLADQYITHVFIDRYVDDDEDQEYIITGLKSWMREKEPTPSPSLKGREEEVAMASQQTEQAKEPKSEKVLNDGLINFLDQIGVEDLTVVDRMSNDEKVELDNLITDWEEVNDEYGKVFEQNRDNIHSKNKAEREAANTAIQVAQMRADAAFAPVEKYVKELVEKHKVEKPKKGVPKNETAKKEPVAEAKKQTEPKQEELRVGGVDPITGKEFLFNKNRVCINTNEIKDRKGNLNYDIRTAYTDKGWTGNRSVQGATWGNSGPVDDRDNNKYFATEQECQAYWAKRIVDELNAHEESSKIKPLVSSLNKVIQSSMQQGLFQDEVVTTTVQTEQEPTPSPSQKGKEKKPAKKQAKAKEEAAAVQQPTQSQKEPKRLVSDDRMEELKKRLKSKLGGQLNVGVDPEVLAIGAEMAVGYIERGITRFADFAKAMINEVGDFMRPYVKSFYNAVRDMPEAQPYADQMDDYQTVSGFDVFNFDKEEKPSVLEKAEQVVQEDTVKRQVKKIQQEQPDLWAGTLFGSPTSVLPSREEEKAAKQVAGTPITKKGDVFLNYYHPRKNPEIVKIVGIDNTGGVRSYLFEAYKDEDAYKNGKQYRVTWIIEKDLEKAIKNGQWKSKTQEKRAAVEDGTLMVSKGGSLYPYAPIKIISSAIKDGEREYTAALYKDAKDFAAGKEATRFNVFERDLKVNMASGAYTLMPKTAWWKDAKRPDSLNPSDYKTYMTDEAREYFANFKSEDGKTDFTKWEHPNLAFITAAAWDGAIIPVEELMQIPEIAEAENRVKEKKNLPDYHIKKQERHELRDRLLDAEHGSAVFENGKIKKVNGKEVFTGPVRQDKKAFVVVGRPAGGKSSVFANRLSNENGARIVDSDVVKPWLSGYDDGYGAGYVQNASADVASSALKKASDAGDNIVLPRIGGGSVMKEVMMLREKGYDVQIFYNEVSAQTSIMRAASRFAQEGRYLSLDYLTNIGNKDSKSFRNFALAKLKDYYEQISTSRPADGTVPSDDVLAGRGTRSGNSDEDYGRGNLGGRGSEDVSGVVPETGRPERTGQERPSGPSEEELIFSYAEWKSNDVAFGEKPKEIWNSKSGQPMPTIGNNETANAEQQNAGIRHEQGSERKPQGTGEGAWQEAQRADDARRGGSTEPDRSVQPGLQQLGPSGEVLSKDIGAPVSTQPGAIRLSGEGALPAQSIQPQNLRNNHAERGKDYAPKGVDARIEANIKAIELMQQLIEEGKKATPAQMKVLRQYSGWGGLGKAFKEKVSYGESGYNPRLRDDYQPANPISQRLRELLGDEAYEQAVMSRNSAYYTPASVIDSMWDIARAMGFKGGNVLEGSAGIGNIIGAMPTDMSERSNIHAVEIDQTTGNILSLLYPDAKVEVQGFEQTEVDNGSVDLAITNVPFVTGLRVIDTTGDKDLSKKFHDIHDFCIAKNIRKLREGGIGIFISSSGTLDNSTKLREWIVGNGNADVVGAFRLNNETFGGTGATSDIIVVRKRVNSQKSANAIDVSTVTGERVAEYDTGEERKVKGEYVPVVKQLSMDYNKYFVEHPEMMGGEMKFGFEMGDTYRPTSKALYPVRGKNQKEMLEAWVQGFDGKSWEIRTAEKPAGTTATQPEVYEALGADVKEGSMVLSNGRLCVAQRGKAVPMALNANKVKGHTKEECFKSYKNIKDALSAVLDYQTQNEDNANLQPLLDKLNRAYDNFVRTYGHLHKNTSISFLKNDVDWPNIFALEKYAERATVDGKRVQEFGKTDVFSKRVVEKEKEPAPQNVKDGIIASIYQFGRIDVPWMVAQLNKVAMASPHTVQEIREEIVKSGLGFEDPVSKEMVVSYEYLSGNVREKLQQAIAAKEKGGSYDANIKALEKVVPLDIPAHLIDFSIGSSWIEPKLYEDYVKDKTNIDVKFTAVGGSWYMKEPYYLNDEKNRSMGVYSEMLRKTVFGTTLIEAAMQNKTITVSETHKKWDGSTETITDKDATAACANKIDEIRQDFKEWARKRMQTDDEYARKIERVYNETFNNYVPKSIPNEFVPEHFGGAATKITLREHQAKAVIRGTTQPLLLAHEVGTGKTFTLISTAMEMRRLGTAKKPMIVVQNATVGQFVESAKELYPNAKVLTIEDADRTAEGRMNFYAKIKYNDWDMIVVPQSVFERIPDSEERQMAYIEEKIKEKLDVLEKMKDADRSGSSMIVRQAEKEIERLNEEKSALTKQISGKRKEKDEKKAAVTRQNAEVRAKEMLDREVDDVENFDDMGIDAILVDEAHEYKHLGFATAMQRGVKGVDPSYSKKAQGVFLKTQAVLEKNNGRNVVFATGTPISNTAAEIWTFMRYLMPADTMKDYGIYYFDDFVRNFGNLQQMLEFTTSGKFKENNRFAGYVNLPELVRIWSGVADTVLTKDAGGVSDKIPELEGGKAQDIYLPQTKALRSVMKYVKAQLKEYDEISGKEKKENSHIPLTMYGIAKAAAVDARLVVDDAEDDSNSKTNEAVRQTLKSLEDTKKYKGTVAIFADNYQNKSTGFNLYEDIRKKLIAAGVPDDQIVVMKSGMSVKKKLEIFDKVNRGDVRVIMGSTFTLGTGVNIQERLHTLIHVDAPNRPMDYTQRNGRILRQGNLHKDMGIPVRVLRFGVEDSLDVTAYQRLKTKGAIADSIMNGKQMMANSMENRMLEEEEDVFGDTVAQLSGSEYAMLKNQAEKDVRKYEAKKKQWEADQTYVHNQIPWLKGNIRSTEKAIEDNKKYLDKVAMISQQTEPMITIGKQKFANMEAMADYIKDFNKSVKAAEDALRKNNKEEKQVRRLTVNVGGIDFEFKTELSLEVERRGIQIFTIVRRRMTYDCPELGITDESVKQSLLREGITDILENVITGNDFRERIERGEGYVAREKENLRQLQERNGKPFEYGAELEKAHKRYDEYSDLMKKELEEKEKKYAQMDADVETATDVVNAEEAEEEEVLYRLDEDEAPVFYSNAERAVTDINQEKATPEQWIRMIEKAGGLKAGEDKWLGLRDWLNGQDKKTLTKQEVLDYIRNNEIQVEEVNYQEGGNIEAVRQKYPNWDDAFFVDEDMFGEASMHIRELDEAVDLFNNATGSSVVIDDKGMITDDEYDDIISFAFDEMSNGGNNAIHPTRLMYTTRGLENKKEIALTVPTIESWNRYDDIHFGDAGEGRAIAWVRFGDTKIPRKDPEAQKLYDEAQKEYDDYSNKMYDKYGPTYTFKLNEEEKKESRRLLDKWLDAKDALKKADAPLRVLVIDEIQSKRHQEGREQGYKKELPPYTEDMLSVVKNNEGDWEIGEDIGNGGVSNMIYYPSSMTREAAVAKFIETHNRVKPGIPDAPFEKNWHELAMKRMLRYAAENGYDKIAWTTGEQQARRYNIGNVIDQVERSQTFGDTGETRFDLQPKNNSGGISLFVKDGVVTSSSMNSFEGKRLEEIVGKDLAAKMMEMSDHSSLDIKDMRIGGEGMKGFYDDMLPRFMNKYGKKWGVKTYDIELPELKDTYLDNDGYTKIGALTMHAIDVTPEMRESVMEGQPLFRLREEPAPKKTGIGYKVFVLKDGELYPPMVANPNGEATPVGVWLDADAAPIAGTSKTGRKQVKAGGKGTQGGSGTLAYRPGWHLGTIPYAIQFNRVNPETGERELFPANFVWAEVEYADDVDYQDEAMSYGYNQNGKFQHALAGLPRVPENGAYTYRTNPNPETDPWVITGAMKVNRILKPSEVDEMVIAAGREPQKRQEGAITDEQVEKLNDELAVMNRPGEVAITSQQTGQAERKRTKAEERRREAYAQRQWRRAHVVAEEAIKKLGIEDMVTIMDFPIGLTGKKAKAKGFFDPKTGKIVIIMNNHRSPEDVFKTILHEAVAHYGLRRLFGEHFDQFLDDVYAYATPEIRDAIDRITATQPQPTSEKARRVATEEYLARLAEDTDFDRAFKSGWFQAIKRAFLNMLHKLGFGYEYYGPALTDNELRYILWRSHENLLDDKTQKEGGKRRYRNPWNPFTAAKDVVMQQKLQVGNFEEEPTPIPSLKGREKQATKVAEQTYAEFKKKYPDALLLMADNDSYFAVGDDAVKLAKVLGGSKFVHGVMADNRYSIPKNELDYALPILVRAGNRIAVKDDVSRAKEGMAGEEIVGTDVKWVDGRTIIEGLAKKYKSKELVFFDLGMSDEELYKQLDFLPLYFGNLIKTPEDLHEAVYTYIEYVNNRKTVAEYRTDTRKIYIFADGLKPEIAEEAFYHENIHGILHDWYGDGARTIADRFWDVAPENGKADKAKVIKKYDKDEQHEELFAYWLSRSMVDGSVDDMLNMFEDADVQRINNILNTIGYDRREHEEYKSSEPQAGRGAYTRRVETQELLERENQGNIEVREAIDEGPLYRDGDSGFSSARAEYELRTASERFANREAWQDSMASLDVLQQAVARETDMPIKDYENAYLYENRMHGKGKNETEQYDRKYYRPMLEAVNALVKFLKDKRIQDPFGRNDGVTYETVDNYLKAKHGLERNQVFAFREAAKLKAKEELDEKKRQLEQDANDGKITTEQLHKSIKDLDKNFGEDVQAILDAFANDQQVITLKGQYERGIITYSELQQALVPLRKKYVMRAEPKRDDDGNLVSDNYYDENVKDYGGLSELMEPDEYAAIQLMREQAADIIDPVARREAYAQVREQEKLLFERANESALKAVDAIEVDEEQKLLLDNRKIGLIPYLRDTAQQRDAVQSVWKRINAATKKTLQTSYDGGMLSRDQYQQVKKMFDWYVPLRGWEEDNADDIYDYVAKRSVFSPSVKKAYGRKSEAASPLATIGNMAVSQILISNRNLLKQHFLNMALNHRTRLISVSEKWYVYVGDVNGETVWEERVPDIPEGASADEIASIIETFNEEMRLKQEAGEAIPAKGRLHLNVHATSAQKSEHMVEVVRNGKVYQLYINGNPKAAQALNGSRSKSISRISDTAVGQVVERANRGMAEFFTSKNPAFVISNLSRDLNMAGATVLIKEDAAYNAQFIKNVAKVLRPRLGRVATKSPHTGPTGLLPSLMRKWKRDELDMNDETERLFAEFINEGGETGFTNMLSVESFKKKMQKELTHMNGVAFLPGSKGQMKEMAIGAGLRKMGEIFEFYNRCAEDATRFIVYMTSRQMGKSVVQSIADAKDVTLNFNRKGTGGRGNAEMRDLFIFVNPAIQALSNMYKLMTGHKLKFGAVTLAFISGGALVPIINQWLINLFGDDNDKNAYWNLPPWVRKNNFVMWVPGTKNFITIPLAQEWRVFYGLGEMATCLTSDHHIEKPWLEGLSSVMDLVPINPTGNAGNMLVNLTPTMFQPLVQIGENIDFTGKPLWRENEGNKYAPMYQKAYNSTPGWMVKLSEFTNEFGGNEGKKGYIEEYAPFWGNYINNPAVWNHLLQGYFGGMYNTIAKSFDVAVTVGSGEVPKVYQTPVLNRFLNRPIERDNAGVLGEEYYGLIRDRDRLRHEVNTYKQKAQRGDEGAQEHLDKLLQSEDWKRAQVITHYEKIMGDLKKGLRAADADVDRDDIKYGMDFYKEMLLEELKALKTGDAIDQAVKRYDEATSAREKNLLRFRIEQIVGRSEGTANGTKRGRSTEVEKALALVNGEAVESKSVNDGYLTAVSGTDIVNDARIRNARLSLKKYADEYQRLQKSGDYAAAAQYRSEHAEAFALKTVLDSGTRRMNEHKKLLGKGYDNAILKLIASDRTQMLQAMENSFIDY